MKVIRIMVFVAAFTLWGSITAFAQGEIPNDLMVRLERTMCFGWCPAYSLTITADGTVTFAPSGNFVHRGDGSTPSQPMTGKITTHQLGVMLSGIERVNFFSLHRGYGRAGKKTSECPQYWTDNPSVIITIELKGKRKTVSHYLGCSGTAILEDLRKFEEEVDEVANTNRWTSEFGWGTGSVADVLLDKDEIASLTTDKQIAVKTIAADPENDILTYVYTVTGGRIIGAGASVKWDLTGVRPGTYTITAGVDDGCGVCGRTMTKTVVVK
ncbi:MAG TPA: DUF6438 domain-containing protein [Pyrinomonadaceae bacterium]|nr:DUF6438 domain-containing protein [Pyrinomonadaceae bacterium]